MSRFYIFFILIGFTILNAEEAEKNQNHYYSQFGQDRYVNEEFFKNRKTGVFVDIGAHDGISLSNTCFFERSLGWKGICIEPIPEVFSKLSMNRDAICIQGCICSNKDTAKFLRVKGYPEMLSGILDKYTASHLRRIDWEIESHGGSKELIEVQCYDLTKLLIDNNMTHVDFLSLDTEGGELDIVKSIDFKLIDIDVITIENNEKTSDIRKYMYSVGYRLTKTLGCDELYVKLNYCPK